MGGIVIIHVLPRIMDFVHVVKAEWPWPYGYITCTLSCIVFDLQFWRPNMVILSQLILPKLRQSLRLTIICACPLLNDMCPQIHKIKHYFTKFKLR